MPPRRMIRASELGEYAYCARAWWLRRVRGVASVNTAALAGGTRAHAAHGRQLGLSRALGWAGLGLALLAVTVLAFAR